MLTRENYFTPEMQLKYMGATQFKDFLNCPAAAIATIKGEYKQEETTSLLVGKYVDAYFSGELEQFEMAHPDIFSISIKANSETANKINEHAPEMITRNGTIKQDKLTECKEKYPQFFDIIKTLKSDYVKANEIIDRINRDELFRNNMGGQHQVIMTGEIEGIAVKIMIDNLHPEKIVDRKIMKDCADMWSDGEKKPFWAAWGYDIQAAIYQSVVAQNIGKKLPFELAVATKETETDLRLFRFKQDTIDNAMGLVRAHIVEFDEMKRGLREVTACGGCEYCRSVRVLTESMVEEI